MAAGKLIVIDGLDGCGKATQAERLRERLEAEGRRVREIAFPDYNDRSSSLVQMYLAGEFGTSPDDVNAYAASSFFAVDRYASYVRYWREDYRSGTIIIANRYSTSNIPHQMSKLPREEWDGFIEWLLGYEYDLLGLPEPDIIIQLDMPPEMSEKLLTSRYDGDESKKDIHESAREYQMRCEECVRYAAKHCGWSVVHCDRDGELLSVEEIGGMVYDAVRNAGVI